jgi:VIT1/CCC1 family predicted Fe2+/Mn2+ transporter
MSGAGTGSSSTSAQHAAPTAEEPAHRASGISLRSLRRAELPTDHPLPEHHHRDIQGGAARAAVFGISDGLVSNVSLVLGVVGASSGNNFVRLAGLAGLLGGAFSMSAGEYVSMRAQRELFQREIEIERRELSRRPEAERRELGLIYQRRGLDPEMASELADKMMATPAMALETHAREELGINMASLGSPWQAAISSFVTFAFGALIPLLPFVFIHTRAAIYTAIALAAVAALGIGVALSYFTGRSWRWSAARQLLVCAAAGAATYGVGSLIGVGTS